jgi:hypothetical protein
MATGTSAEDGACTSECSFGTQLDFDCDVVVRMRKIHVSKLFPLKRCLCMKMAFGEKYITAL